MSSFMEGRILDELIKINVALEKLIPSANTTSAPVTDALPPPTGSFVPWGAPFGSYGTSGYSAAEVKAIVRDQRAWAIETLAKNLKGCMK